MAVSGKNTGVGKQPGGHESSTNEQCRAASPAIDEEESGNGHRNVDDILNGGGEQQVVATKTSHGKDVTNVVHHDIHAGELRPNLGKDADVGSVDHVGLEKLEVGNVGVAALELAHILDLFEFAEDEGIVLVAFGVDKSENLMRLLPAVTAGQPTRRFGHEHETQDQAKSRNHLQSPWNAKRGSAGEVGSSIRDVEHDHDTYILSGNLTKIAFYGVLPHVMAHC